MWKPDNPVRWKPDSGRPPSAAQAAASKLYSPIKIGPIELRHRTWVPAMVPWRASADGQVTDEILNWYGRFARGRPGAIVVEATGIRDIPSGPLLRIGDDRFLPGLERLGDTIRRESGGETRIFIQIIDFLTIRRRPEPDKYFRKYLRLTQSHRRAMGAEDWPEDDVREALLSLPERAWSEVLDAREYEALTEGYRERVTDTHLDHIRDLPTKLPSIFAAAAGRARQAGFDGVELHYAHAYTMASFLSARNSRTDGYGGDLKGRIRLPLEVYRAARETVGNGFALGCRFLSDDCIEGGSGVEDAEYFGAEFARAGMDFLSLSRGGKFEDAKQPKIGWTAYPYTGRSGYECMPSFISDAQGPFGRNVEPAARIRATIRVAGYDTPVVVTGGIHGFEQAEAMLEGGQADIIGAARQSLADPDWYLKYLQGRGAEIRACEYTNYCEGLDQKHKMVTCKLWDRFDLDEDGILLTPDGKRRQVAPG